MNSLNLQIQNPVAVGGVGGSGTRLIAEIVMKARYYLGDSLNGQLDNLWFTLLLKRPRWFARSPPDSEIIPAVELFKKAMIPGLSSIISQCETDYILEISPQLEYSPLSAALYRNAVNQLIASEPPNFAKYIGWGWKVPNTHIFLPQIVKAIEGLKYIHVIRNGLDMAFSTNQQQYRNWHTLFDVAPANGEAQLPSLSLGYWIAANRRAIEFGTKNLRDRFLLVNYDRFCANPEPEIHKLMEFLGVTFDSGDFADLIQMVSPRSIGRYKEFPTGSFSQLQLETVREFGFDV